MPKIVMIGVSVGPQPVLEDHGPLRRPFARAVRM